MSIMFLKIRSVSRGQGGSAVAKAAYIARDRIRDAASGRVHDYRKVAGLEHAEILLPADAPAAAAEWARDRPTLWNHAEAAERSRNARVAREYTVALPHELSRDARLALARQFAQSIADHYGAVADLAVHGPTARGDPRNHHAHILTTTRELGSNGLGRKATIELGSSLRREHGLPHVAYEFRALRARWAELANEKLREAHLEARLEPRSCATLARERSHPERAAAAAWPAAPPAPAPAAQPEQPAAIAAPDTHVLPPPSPERALTLELAQRRAVERWLAYRAGQGSDPAPTPARDRARARELDAGLEL